MPHGFHKSSSNVTVLINTFVHFHDEQCVLGAGKLYNPDDNTIGGLKAAHFISMATPHLGVAGQGDYRVSKHFHASP